jgi:arsenate reductase
MGNKKRVLILCTGNSARSQIAEGLLRHIAGETVEVESAGVEPSFVRPEAIQVMREIGIDISHHRSKSVDEFLDSKFDLVITVCDNANQRCPIFPGAPQRIHWSIADPAGAIGDEATRLRAFRDARNDLRQRILALVGETDPANSKNRDY